MQDTGNRFYDDSGNPISFDAWIALFEGTPDPHVAEDILDDGTRVSTVWLGLDQSFWGGPPLIFETMIFGGKHDQYQERYSTKDQALEGHKHALALARGEA